MAVPTAPKLIMLTVATLMITMFSTTCLARNVLLNGEVLSVGKSLKAGSYEFIMQEDCNLVLYEPAGPVWASNTGTTGRDGCLATLLNDGSVVIYDLYDKKNSLVWSSKSNGAKGNYVLVLQEDRNVVIYGTDVWSTGTYIKTINGVAVTAMNGTVVAGLGSPNATTIVRKILHHKTTAVGQVEVAAA